MMNHRFDLGTAMMLEFGAVPMKYMKMAAEENMQISIIIDEMGVHVR